MDRTANEIAQDIRRQFPSYPATFGPCVNGCEGEVARGSGPCLQCLADELVRVAGFEPAWRFINPTVQAAKALSEIMEAS